jgi:hypothetical protein
MSNNNRIHNTRDFLSYIKTPLSQSSLDILYSSNNIRYERCQLFCDFTVSLICKIMDTYMGDSIMNVDDRLDHFKWCWNSTLKDFENEGIEFNNSIELHNYFQQHMIEAFYLSDDKSDNETTKIKLINLWRYILSNTTNKTQSDVDTFLELYKMFEKTL